MFFYLDELAIANYNDLAEYNSSAADCEKRKTYGKIRQRI